MASCPGGKQSIHFSLGARRHFKKKILIDGASEINLNFEFESVFIFGSEDLEKHIFSTKYQASQN